MIKTKRNVLLTILSAFLVGLLSIGLLLASPKQASAETKKVIMPNTSEYFETPLVKGIDLSNKVVRFYYDDQMITASGMDLGQLTYDDKYGLSAEGSVYIDLWDDCPIYRSTSEYFEIYLDVDYITSEVTRLMIEDGSWDSEADGNFNNYFKQAVSFDIVNFPDMGETSAPNPEFVVYVLSPVPDTSKYIETEKVDDTTSLKNKVVRVYNYNAERVFFEIQANGPLFDNVGKLNVFDGKVVPINEGVDYVDYYFNEDVLWAFCQYDDITPDDFFFSCVLGDEEMNGTGEDYKGVWVLEAPEEPEEPDNSIEDEKVLDKWAGWVNDQTGWALTGSSLGIIAVAVVIVIIIKRK